MIRSNKLEQYMERCEEANRPITAEIFLTDYCNLNCNYCRYANDSGKYMQFNDFVTYTTRLLRLGVRGIILTGGGEPTLNPHFRQITDWLERNKISYGINTNLCNPIFCNANFVKVSIDAGDAKRYEELRGRDRLQNVLTNLGDLIAYKKRNLIGMKIGVQCVASNREDDIISFYDAVKNYEVDYIYVRPLESTERIGLSKENVRKVLPINEDKRIDISYKFDFINYTAPWCLANWSVITVNVDGNVPYCCHRPNEIVGHILDLNIMDAKARHHVDIRQCERPCRLSGANKYLEELRTEKDINFI